MPSPEEAIIAAEKLIDQRLPKNGGWVKEFVEPPWRGMPPKCRGCGRDPAQAAIVAPGLKWATATILNPVQERKVMRYSFGLVCENCAKDKTAMNRVHMEVFGQEQPEGGGVVS